MTDNHWSQDPTNELQKANMRALAWVAGFVWIMVAIIILYGRF